VRRLGLFRMTEVRSDRAFAEPGTNELLGWMPR
jgi:hypothetical protein